MTAPPGQNEPASQVVHWLCEESPPLASYVPGAHDAIEVPPVQNDPIEQVVHVAIELAPDTVDQVPEAQVPETVLAPPEHQEPGQTTHSKSDREARARYAAAASWRTAPRTQIERFCD